MADVFVLQGSYSSSPASGTPSLDPMIDAPIDESMVLSAKEVDSVTLSDGTPKDVSLGDLSGANVVIIRAFGAKVRARITSADGTTQSIPVDPMLMLLSVSVPITAIDLTRDAGSSTVTTVKVFLGLKA